jgi:asparagine synthetase B (glutamine-hydrolysing)
MCGVAAIFAFDPRAEAVDRTELRTIRDAMRTRGPDGSGEWLSADGRVGLAHRRLSIIDLSDAAAQLRPFWCRSIQSLQRAGFATHGMPEVARMDHSCR